VNILVTGGAGFIGSNFTRFWVEHHPGDHAVVLDHEVAEEARGRPVAEREQAQPPQQLGVAPGAREHVPDGAPA